MLKNLNLKNQLGNKAQLPAPGDVSISSPIGTLHLQLEGHTLTNITFGASDDKVHSFVCSSYTSIISQFQQYFQNPHFIWSLPYRLKGTPHQLKVWHTLLKIPVGQTMTYGELAANIGSSPRAVGGALKQNPCPIVVPCHRVVAKNGLGGFSGQIDGPLLAIKTWLLKHEGLSWEQLK